MDFILDPFNALGNILLGYIKAGRAQKWGKLVASLSISAFVTFWGTWGLAISTLYSAVGPVGALILGFAAACVAMSTTVLFLWRRHPLTKELMVSVPGDIETELLKTLQDKTMVTTGKK